MPLTDNEDYQLLPFQFSHFDCDTCLLVNESGEFIFLSNDDFLKLVNKELTSNAPSFYDLKSRHFITTGHLSETLELVAAKYRTRKKFISDFTIIKGGPKL
jgi:uncharacterized protein